ncbi:hypothetical protein [Dictyobacter arantiisoli]|uniref:Uncharacterized protein n=1 Tax=Dictyobacter arantiisoli TaxID=2014874 RepID=A0A5A5T790_9CHLR|nr:hypothetical protein [Dictyobacter arantiisoli]GCF07340.1 hypothetical protein KDI_09040 [Dictyobacter arantiisoli]
MKQTFPKSTVSAAHNAFAQTMIGFEHAMYANFHHLTYLPIILFLIAGGILLASFSTKHGGARAASYAVAILLVVACVFII